MKLLLCLLVIIPVALCEMEHWTEINRKANLSLIEGDIMPSPFNNVMRSRGMRWPGNTLYYKIANGHPCRNRIKSALAQLQSAVGNCVKFVEDYYGRRPHHAEYFVGGGCYSMVGMQPRAQRISIGNGCCYNHIIQHETFHALGFFHEQNRLDRDRYLTIYWNNIRTDMRYNFDLKSAAQADLLGTPFDFKSIMLYRSNAFSYTGQDTMRAKSDGHRWGDNTRLSYYDIYRLKKYYDC